MSNVRDNQDSKPAVRFKGFSDAWEKRKLGEIALFNPKSKLPAKFEYVDLESVVGTEMISHRTEALDDAPSRAQRLAQHGDVFYQTVRPYQKNNYLFELHENNYVFSTGYAQMRPVNSGNFLLARLQEGTFVAHVLARSTGTSYPAINASDLERMRICVPDAEEQSRIGKLFRCIDHLIAVNQRKAENLQKLKKSLLQQMFVSGNDQVPKIRFKGFADAWEQRKLGDIVVFLNGRAYKQAELLDSGKYPVLRVGNFNTNDKWYYSDLELPAKNYADKGDLLYTWATAFGPHIWKGPKVIYHYHIWKVETTSDISKNFAVHLLDADQAQMTNSLNGSTMVHITKGTMENKIVTIPGISEQRNMARLLDQLDCTIALHQRKVENLQKLKKSLLRLMFI